MMFTTLPEEPTGGKPRNTRKLRIGLIIGGICALIAVVAVVFLVALGGRKDSDKETGATPTVSATEAPTEAPTATPSPTASPTPSMPPLTALGQGNPLGIEGYEYYPGGNAVTEAGDLKLFAHIPADAKLNSAYLLSLELFECDEEGVLLQYSTSSELPSEDMDLVEDSPREFKTVLASFASDGTLRTKEFGYEDAFRSLGNGAQWILYDEFGQQHFSWFSRDLEESNRHSFGDTTHSVYYTEDGEHCYFVKEEPVPTLCRYNEAGEEELLTIPKFRLSTLNGVITDADGNDFLLVNAMAGDLQTYSLVVNAQTMEVLYIAPGYGYYTEVDYSTYLESHFDPDLLLTTRWIASHDGHLAQFDFPDADSYAFDSRYPTPYILKDTRILFVQYFEDSIALSLFDIPTASLIGSVHIPSNGEMLYFKCLPVSDSRYLLTLGDLGAQSFYLWEPDSAATADTSILVSKYEEGTRPSLEVSHEVDLNFFTPGTLSAELQPLKDRAQMLTDRYGIEILLGEECTNCINSYCIYPCTDYDFIEAALSVLETELAKYPDDFFLQMIPEYMDGNAIYLAGDIPYYGTDNRGQSAAFRTDFQGQQVIVMDILQPDLDKTLHHEISHIIDSFVLSTCAWDGSDFFTEDGWLALNPSEDIYGPAYSYTYSRYVLSDFLYQHDYILGLDYTDSYYVDSYSTTYPTEDRARIWENAMADYSSLDFSAAPALDAKLDYYIAGIEAAFDTSAWPEDNFWNLAQN